MAAAKQTELVKQFKTHVDSLSKEAARIFKVSKELYASKKDKVPVELGDTTETFSRKQLNAMKSSFKHNLSNLTKVFKTSLKSRRNRRSSGGATTGFKRPIAIREEFGNFWNSKGMSLGPQDTTQSSPDISELIPDLFVRIKAKSASYYVTSQAILTTLFVQYAKHNSLWRGQSIYIDKRMRDHLSTGLSEVLEDATVESMPYTKYQSLISFYRIKAGDFGDEGKYQAFMTELSTQHGAQLSQSQTRLAEIKERAKTAELAAKPPRQPRQAKPKLIMKTPVKPTEATSPRTKTTETATKPATKGGKRATKK